MFQSALFATPSFTVTEFTRRVRRLLEGDPALADAWVQGEISNISRPVSGHIYFTLKDGGASLRCVMWKGDAYRFRGITLQDGMHVDVHGKLTVYEINGQYQLVVDFLRPGGEGALYAEFLRLKAMLEAEGLFDPDRKRALPELPQIIGIVTSASGAALQDMLNTLRRRLPLATVALAASPVQGNEAPRALVEAIQLLNSSAQPDVILLARGGGSIEDLWAFNDERVVRAVASSQVPVISGVGHETDFTLVDFAADRRAPTPTAAAELATPITTADLYSNLEVYRQRIDELINRQISADRMDLTALKKELGFYSPARRLLNEIQQIDDFQQRAQNAVLHQMMLASTRLKGLSLRLETLSPLGILKRGYALVSRAEDGQLIYNASQAPVGSALNIRLAAGELDVMVKKSKMEEV